MATRLAEFADGVHTRLAAKGVSVRKHDDASGLSVHGERRRIVWLSQGGTLEPPKQAGGRLPSDGTQYRVRICKIRVEQIEAHIFAEDREQTEVLFENVIASAWDEALVVEMPSYRWITEESASNGRTLRSHYCVLRINLRLPVPDEIKALTEVIEIDHVCGTLTSADDADEMEIQGQEG